MRTIPYPKEFANLELKHPVTFTSPAEVRALLGLASTTTGGILEVGCSIGTTTRVLAEAFPDRRIYALDWLGNTELNEMQMGERPTIVAEVATKYQNVIPFNEDSRRFQYPKDVGFVFIDGDHTYEAVKADSELAWAFARTHPLLIAWHDVNSPYHVFPTTYLKECAEQGRDIVAIAGTMLAYCDTRKV